MAYGKRYIIAQKTHDCVDLTVEIYEKDYVGSITTYQAVSAILQPNSADEDPVGCIISSELDVSFTISTNEDYANFLDLLDFDDTKYYVELVIDGVVKWKGFLFNDFSEVGFTGGTQQVNIKCIDGLSFLRYSFFDNSENTNIPVKLLDIIGTCLNKIQYKDMSFVYSLCSYFADGMFDRGDAIGDEPFRQTFQYRRDFVGLDYYTVLENIVKSFGCRLFQANGDWWILPMNQMDSTLYYTRYAVFDVPIVSGTGIFVNNITIRPYSENNVHFVGGDQVKIVRKGYPSIESEIPVRTATNYIFNGAFKNVDLATDVAEGWYVTKINGGNVDFIESQDAQLNTCLLFGGPSKEAWLSNKIVGAPNPYLYTAKMYAPGASLSLEMQECRIRLYISVLVGSTTYYLNSSDKWQTSETFRDIFSEKNNVYTTLSFEIPLGLQNNIGVIVEGYVNIEFRAVDGAQGGYIRNIKLTQNEPPIQAVIITRKIAELNSTSRSVDIPYGLVYNNSNTIGTMYNNVGLFVNENGVPLVDWYRYGKPEEAFECLPYLIMRQYSNLLNRNIATLEGNLGAYTSPAGLVYLDKVFLVEDPETSPLSYNGKKFLINRLDLDPANILVGSIQLVEVTNVDNASVESVEYIGDINLTKPKRYFK